MLFTDGQHRSHGTNTQISEWGTSHSTEVCERAEMGQFRDQ